MASNRVGVIDQDKVRTVARLLAAPTEDDTARCNGTSLAHLLRMTLIANVNAVLGPRQTGFGADTL